MQETIQSPFILRFYQSSIGKKLITGVTGIGLSLFVLTHMVGNLLMFVSHDAYNAYAYRLEQLGPLFWAVEIALAAVFLMHAATGIHIFWHRLQARTVSYDTYASKGSPSLQSLSSRTMIITGSVLGVFLILHLLSFKFGTYYSTTLANHDARDLARLVVEKFRHPLYAFGYSGVILLLGFHLRHGLWSAWQSLGAMSKTARSIVYGASLTGAVGIAIGFVALPLSIYFGWVN